MSKISDRQMEILRALDRIGQPAEWGDDDNLVKLTDDGRALVELAKRERAAIAKECCP